MVRDKIKKEKSFDLVWFEKFLRAAAMNDLRELVESFLNDELPFLLPESELKDGKTFHSVRTRKVETLFGSINLRRPYYRAGQSGRSPMDEILGLHGKYTQSVAQLMCWAGAMDDSFELASETLKRFAGLDISGRQVQRIIEKCAPKAEKWNAQRPDDIRSKPVDIINIQTDMTGIPVREEELENIKGKAADGKPKTRQIKVGCVFTQSKGKNEEQLRDPFSSSYIAEFADPNDHANALWNEALKRGYATAREKVFLGDGAEWIWNIASSRFNDAVQIVDFYHACEHLNTICKLLENNEEHMRVLFKKWRKRLKNNGLPGLLYDIECRAEKLTSEGKQAVLDELPYFRNNARRMTYRTFIRKRYFIGSGAVEGACRHIVAQRAKLSGMRWLCRGAQNVLSFRSIIKSGHFDNFCDQRLVAA